MIPYRQLAIFIVVAAVAGVATAILPAWRAARLNVLDAISVEFFSTGDRRNQTFRGRKIARDPLLRSSAPRAISSEVEHFLDTEGVGGSSPLSPTTAAGVVPSSSPAEPDPFADAHDRAWHAPPVDDLLPPRGD